MFISFTIDACRVQLLRWFKKKKGGIGPPHKLLLFPLLLFFILLLTQPKTDQEQREEGGEKESEMTFGWLDEGLKKERKKKAIHILRYLENGLSSPPSANQAEGAETAATLRAEEKS